MKDIVTDILSDYAQTPQGSWLNDFDWRKVKVYKMPFVKEGVVVAMYIGPINAVFLEDVKKIKDPLNIWATDVIHEFYHAYQYHTKGPIKYLLTKVFNRKKLEDEAVNASLEWLNADMEEEHWIIK